MKRSIDGAAAARQVAERAINDRFNRIAQANAQKDAEHKAKRDTALAVLAGEQPPQPFLDEADLMGVDPEAFADLIVSKPDEVLARGLERRRLVMAVRNAASPDAVRAVMLGAAFPANYDEIQNGA